MHWETKLLVAVIILAVLAGMILSALLAFSTPPDQTGLVMASSLL
jgi:hypothetical protein